MNTAEAFATAYADAVCAFVQTGVVHHVNWSPGDGGWFADPADPGSGADDQDFLVGSTWSSLVGPVDVVTDCEALGFSAVALHHAVRSRVLHNGVGATAVALKAIEAPARGARR